MRCIPAAANFSWFLALGLGAGLLVSTATATELGGSVYPAGIETVMPGMAPPPGVTVFLEFENVYQANALLNGAGHSEIPGFHLRVVAVAVKVVHNWGLRVLGGTLVSYAALPFYMNIWMAPLAPEIRPDSPIRIFSR